MTSIFTDPNTPLTLGLGINDWLHSVWFKPGNSDLAPSVDFLFMYITWVCIISFVGLMVPMAWWAFKYRRKPGVPQQRTPNHNTVLEALFIIVPLILVTVIFFWGFVGYMKAQVAATDAEVLSLSAKKWAWSVVYPNGAQSGESVYFDSSTLDGKIRRGNEAKPVFVVPQNRPVKFMMSSVDVIHSFYIPDMRLKIDVFPNRLTSMTFVPISASGPDQASTLYPDAKMAADAAKGMGRDHYIFCAEYCGTNHSEMGGVLRVMTEADYIATVTEWADIDDTFGPGADKKGRARQPLYELGRVVWKNRGCAQCHSIDGGKNTGPSWKGYYGKPIKFLDGKSLGDETYPGIKGMEDVWNNYIRESIIVPAARIHEGYANQMPAYTDLSEKQLAGVIALMRQLNGLTDSPVAASLQTSDVKPTEVAPGDAKPADSTPADAKPTEAMPGDAKPPAVTPPAPKPADPKP